jgi:hypothetical protein
MLSISLVFGRGAADIRDRLGEAWSAREQPEHFAFEGGTLTGAFYARQRRLVLNDAARGPAQGP